MDDLIAEFNSIIEQWKRISLDDPRKGLALADDAVKCAERLGNAFMARALAVRGSALKLTGAHNESEEVLLGILENLDECDAAQRADVLRRIAYLRVEQRRFDEAILAIDEGIPISRALSRHQQGTMLLAKGFIYGEMAQYHEALSFFAESLALLSPKECPVSYDVAIHNIIVAISLDERIDLATLKVLLKSLDSARRGLTKKSRIFRLKLKWAASLVDLRLGMNNKALTALLGVRRELKRLRRPSIELAMVSIDVAQAYLESGDFDRCCDMLEKALRLIEATEGVNPSAAMSMVECLESLRANQFKIEKLLVARRALLKPDTIARPQREYIRSMQYSSD